MQLYAFYTSFMDTLFSFENMRNLIPKSGVLEPRMIRQMQLLPPYKMLPIYRIIERLELDSSADEVGKIPACKSKKTVHQPYVLTSAFLFSF
jgi:hypothetical protein